MKSEFRDQVILITGSSQGIGKSLAIYLGIRGAKICLNGRNTEKLKETNTELNGLGIDNFMVPGDVTDYSICEKIIEDIVSHYGKLDGIVANASMMVESSIQDVKPEVFSNAIDSQILGAVFPVKAGLSEILKSKGYILLISSLSALYGVPRFSAYSMGKRTYTNLAQSLRFEHQNSGIAIGVAYVCFTKNEPRKQMILPNGELCELPKRPTKLQHPREKVAKSLALMIKFRRKTKTLSLYGKAYGFFSRYIPLVIKIFVKRRLPI